MLTDQKRSLECSGLGTKGEHGTFFGPANCGGNFILEGGKLDVYAKMWRDCGATEVSLDFIQVVDTSLGFLSC